MRIGLMIGPEQGRYRHKVAQLIADAEAAERAGFTSIWVPQIPGRLRRVHRDHAHGARDRADRARDRGPADPDPSSDRHGAGGAVEPGGVRGPLHARARRVAPLGHRGHARPSVRAAGPPAAQLPRGPERGARAARARWTSRTTGTACTARWTSRTTPRRRSCSRPSAPVMLRIAGEQASGTILWMADERAIAEHVVPRITKAAAGRPAPRIVAGVPVALCPKDEVDAAREWANRVLGHAEYSPNYQRLLEHGRRHRRGRHPRGGGRVGHRRSPARLPRRGRHRSRGSHPRRRARPRRAHRIAQADRGVPRIALSRALTPRRSGHRS